MVDRSAQTATYGSGGGITWDSTATREWEEVLLKARALEGPPALTSDADGLIETMAFDPAAGYRRRHSPPGRSSGPARRLGGVLRTVPAVTTLPN